MLMAVNEPYALMVQPDDILISPREVDEHFGTMVCFHPRYALGDHHNHMDKDDFLREMYLDIAGHIVAVEPEFELRQIADVLAGKVNLYGCPRALGRIGKGTAHIDDAAAV